MSQPLKRSQKTEFPLARERSFNRTSMNKEHHFVKRQKSHSNILSLRPAMEIYRPPNVRTTDKLNVHAKEFTMSELQNSKSSENLFEPHIKLQHSKSSGNILRHHVTQIPLISLPMLNSNQVLNMPVNYSYGHHPVFSQQPPPSYWSLSSSPSSLKRSKSLGSTEYRNNTSSKVSDIKASLDLTIFPGDVQTKVKLAMDDPSQLSTRATMDLVKAIVDQSVQRLKYGEACAKVCVFIVKQSPSQTFLESLLNTCQQFSQERDSILRGIKAGDGTRFTAFMWFLTELYAQLKRYLVTDDELQPDLVILSLIARCCQACVAMPIKCVAETECLFFVLTSIGKDLESELPAQLEQLLVDVRDAFLATVPTTANSGVRRTLLQLIELHASNWQLPGSSVLYYYPRIK